MRNFTSKIQMPVILSLILFFLVTYCFVKCKSDSNDLVSIEALYFKGRVESSVPLSCGGFASINSGLIKDTVLTDKQKLHDIEHQFLMLMELNVDTINSCDVRIQCKLNFKKRKPLTICIGAFNCLIRDFKRIPQNDTFVYLIKKYSGYYNYFSKEELSYFEELKQLGIPNDYKDLRRLNNPDSVLLPPR